jgi:hypothetical protein
MGCMEIAEILHQLERATGKFPRAAVDAAVERREEIVPELLRVLEDTLDRAEQLATERDHMANLYAMYLLAQFRETRAYPLVIRIASLPGDLADSVCGGFLADGLGKVLASVCGGDLKEIQSLIENEEVDGYARWSGLNSLVALVSAGQKSREEILDYFAQLFRGKLKREWSLVWDGLVCCSRDLYLTELMDDIERAFEEGLVDTSVIDLDDVKCALASGEYEEQHGGLVDDIVSEMEWWACFREYPPSPVETPLESPVKSAPPIFTEVKPMPLPLMPAEPIRRTTPKTGRNEPCPCGSGKKYKKCCGA